MKTYIARIKHKVHWLHLTSAVVVLSVLASATLLQYADQQFASANALQPSNTRFHHLSKQVLGTKIVNHSGQVGRSGQVISLPSVSRAATTNSHQANNYLTNSFTASASQKSTSVITPVAPSPGAGSPAPPAYVNDIATEATCPGQASLGNAAPVLACLTAYARTQHGLKTVSSSAVLNAAAAAKVGDMLTCGYSHTACGREFNYWFAIKGFTGRCTAENIAMGQLTPAQVFRDWMNSAGHRANILNPSYSVIGAAVTAGSGGNLWAMELGGC